MPRADVPLNDPDGEGMWPDSSGLWMVTEKAGTECAGYLSGRAGDRQVTPIDVAGQVLYLQVGPRHAWDPRGLDLLTRDLADCGPGPVLPTTAQLAATFGRVSAAYFAILGALSFLTWSVVPVEAAAQSVGAVWCLFVVYAIARRGK